MSSNIKVSDPKSAILLVSNLFSTGLYYGAVCRELAEKLTQSGWSVTTTSSVKNRFLRPLDMLKTIVFARSKYSLAIIDVFSGAAFRWAELSAWWLLRLQKPFVLALHGGNLPDFSRQHPKRVERLLKSAIIVTTPSRYLLENMEKYRAGIELMPNPIDITSLVPLRQSSDLHRLLFVRAFHSTYNPVLAIHTLHALRKMHLNVRLAMIGPDKGDGTQNEVESMIQALKLNEMAEIVGAVPKKEVPTYLNNADIFINTANVDNTPVSVIEAMACGLCIVSTNVGGIPYLLDHDHDALLVPPNDPEAMAYAVRRILTEPGLAEHLSRNARAKAEQFDWSVILPKWETLLLQIALSSEREIV